MKGGFLRSCRGARDQVTAARKDRARKKGWGARRRAKTSCISRRISYVHSMRKSQLHRLCAATPVSLSRPLPCRADSRFTFPDSRWVRRCRRHVFPATTPGTTVLPGYSGTAHPATLACNRPTEDQDRALSRQCRIHGRAACWRCRLCCAVSWRTQVPLACTY